MTPLAARITQDMRESFNMEVVADMLAMQGQFGEASFKMKQVNKLRASYFGRNDPNELRDMARAALDEGT